MVGLSGSAQTFDFSCIVHPFDQCLRDNPGVVFNWVGNASSETISYNATTTLYELTALGNPATRETFEAAFSFIEVFYGGGGSIIPECSVPEPELPSIDPTVLSDCMKASIGTEVPVNSLDSNNTYIIVYQHDFRLYRNSVTLSNLVTSDDSLEDLVMYGNTNGLFNLQGVECPDPVAVLYDLDIVLGGLGSGMVTADPLPTNGMYDENTVVTLTATADEGSSFREWVISEPAGHILHAGGNRPMTPSITVTITEDMRISAEFDTATTEVCTTEDFVRQQFDKLHFRANAPNEWDQGEIILEAQSGTTTTVIFTFTTSVFPYTVPSGVTTATTRITLVGGDGCIEDIETIN